MKQRGFTLIELLVVIAIISVLSSIVFASFKSVRMKARDARRISDFKAISTGLAFYYDKYGKYPKQDDFVPFQGSWNGNYKSMAEILVTEGFMPSVLNDPKDILPYVYEYFNYHNYPPIGKTTGGLLVTRLEAAPDTTTGILPSCRPWAAYANWCSQIESKEYCICHPY